MNYFNQYEKQIIKEAKTAKQNGIPKHENPYKYNSEIKEFCLWAAGWQDAKKPLTHSD
jgi:hypothetical protein